MEEVHLMEPVQAQDVLRVLDDGGEDDVIGVACEGADRNLDEETHHLIALGELV